MQAAGLPSNILIIYLQTYKNKVSKVVILVVIFYPRSFISFENSETIFVSNK